MLACITLVTEIPELTIGEAVAVDWTFEEYLDDRSALTRSSLALASENPRAFRDRWILGEPEADSGSKSKTRGTLSHLWLLEPAEWCRRVGIPQIPRPDAASGKAKKGSRERELYDSWRRAVAQRESVMAAVTDRVDVTLGEFQCLQAITKSVWSHEQALTLLSVPGRAEQTVLWREPTTGLLVKVRLDRYVDLDADEVYGTELAEGPGVVDVKTTRDHMENAFGRSIVKLGYLPQAALYTDAVEALIGVTPTFYFIAAKNESNWGTAVYRLDSDQLARGRRQYQRRLLDVLERKFKDDWLAECERGVRPIYIPDWNER